MDDTLARGITLIGRFIGVDTPITLLWLAKTVYPNAFADIDIIEETQKYYREVFEIDLSTDQAASIFAPAASVGAGF